MSGVLMAYSLNLTVNNTSSNLSIIKFLQRVQKIGMGQF